jgi:hypothetical protein
MRQTDPDFGGVSSCSTLRGNAPRSPVLIMICHNADAPASPGDHDEEK